MCLCSETHDVITINDSSDEDEINDVAVVMQSCNSSSSSSVCQHPQRVTPATGDLRPRTVYNLRDASTFCNRQNLEEKMTSPIV